MNFWLLSASVLTAAIWAIHTFLGGRSVAHPLILATDLEPVPKWTQYYCWHMVTITLAVMSIGLGYAALVSDASEVALLIGLLAVAFSVFGLLLPPRVKVSYVEMPQGFLFLPVVGLVTIGLIR